MFWLAFHSSHFDLVCHSLNQSPFLFQLRLSYFFRSLTILISLTLYSEFFYKMLSLLSAILCLLFFASAVEVAIGGYAPLPTPLIVETRTGRVLGTTLTSRSGRKFAAFLGIPYARPPIGTRRFQAPEPMYLWDEVFNATKYGPICPQLDFPQPDPTKFPPPPKDKKGTGDEDCLKLNVFSNGYLNNDYQQENELLPVLVFIHGGFFMSGSGGYYGPRYLMDHDIILVTFNYRLGPFGFLSTEDLHAPGNAGMKDQVLVLKWIQRNIKSFGGDPARVTIYGQSAGSVSVQLHMLTPASEGKSGTQNKFKKLKKGWDEVTT